MMAEMRCYLSRDVASMYTVNVFVSRDMYYHLVTMAASNPAERKSG